jgi:hypothetical protein
MVHKDITAPMKDNETWNTCPSCGVNWQDIPAIPGLLHRTKLCDECQWAYFCEKCNDWFKPPLYCIHKYNPEAPALKGNHE